MRIFRDFSPFPRTAQLFIEFRRDFVSGSVFSHGEAVWSTVMPIAIASVPLYTFSRSDLCPILVEKLSHGNAQLRKLLIIIWELSKHSTGNLNFLVEVHQ